MFYTHHRQKNGKEKVVAAVPSNLVKVTVEPVVLLENSVDLPVEDPEQTTVHQIGVAVMKSLPEGVSPFLSGSNVIRKLQVPCQQTLTIWASFVRDMEYPELHKLRRHYRGRPCTYCGQECVFQLMATRPSF